MIRKSNTSGIINTINEIITIARNRKIVHLYAEDEILDGRTITLDGKKMLNFGSCSYLGLEMDPRLKEASIDAVKRFGTQFSSSRTYVSFPLYKDLEEHLQQIFKAPIILSTCSTLGHQAVIPIVVEDNDAVILDQQVHYSMQEPVNHLQLRGVHVTKLRHSRLDELQTKINELSPKHNKIWYFADGVYSMYGDLAPMHELIDMLNKNKQLHLYVDDAHGMSWAGTNGSGTVLAQVPLHPKMIHATSLAKAFGSAGGVFAFPNEELYWRVKNWGGPLTHSGPQQPAVIGASLASAKIHLTNEIDQLQEDLAEKILYCNEVLHQLGLPVVSESIAPIFFIGLGLPKVGYNMVRRMADDGFYVNLGVFPAVPETCTGVRFTITRHHTNEDIDRLAERLAFNLPLALKDEERTMDDIYRAFRTLQKPKKEANEFTVPASRSVQVNYNILKENTIEKINPAVWNSLFEKEGAFDWTTLSALEKTFSGNKLPEHNWDFRYIIITDELNKPVVGGFFTAALVKDDMMSNPEVSREIELKRKSDPYLLTSKAFMLGSLVTEGNHLYIDRNHSEWKKALSMFMDVAWYEQEALKANTILLRDFPAEDEELKMFFIDQGFVKAEMPDVHSVSIQWKNREEYIAHLSSKKRLHLKQNVLPLEQEFEVNIVNTPDQAQVAAYFELYKNVAEKSLEINNFLLPDKLFSQLALTENWEFVEFRLKNLPQKPLVAFFLGCTNTSYSNAIIGMNYDYLQDYKIYKQALFQSVIRAIDLNVPELKLGFTADFEKYKIGALPKKKIAFFQAKDSFNQSVISMLVGVKKEAVTIK